jgi:hypothetical protein
MRCKVQTHTQQVYQGEKVKEFVCKSGDVIISLLVAPVLLIARDYMN